MIDFTPFRENSDLSLARFAAGFSQADLRRATHEMVDRLLDMLVDCTDEDVVFTPVDPQAHDAFAENPDEADLAWNLGHLVAHVTASAEECAFLAAELARGVARSGRSRSEVPWQEMTTIAQCRQRLAESRRMRLATLDVWPDAPYLDTVRAFSSPRIGHLNAVGYYLFGMLHEDGHLAQIADVIAQAKVARGVAELV